MTRQPCHSSCPWTDASPANLIRWLARYHRRQRSDFTFHAWTLEFVVLHDGEVIGAQCSTARRFAARKVVATGSWMSQSRQGHGFGTEMRYRDNGSLVERHTTWQRAVIVSRVL